MVVPLAQVRAELHREDPDEVQASNRDRGPTCRRPVVRRDGKGDDGQVQGSDDIDEDDAYDACAAAWEERAVKESKPRQPVFHKTHAETVQGFEFVMSDGNIDRMGDMISSDGWDVAAFKKNPICLFNHSPMHPIGKWSNLRVDGGQLKGRLELAPKGIRVNGVHPTVTLTPMAVKAWSDPDKAAGMLNRIPVGRFADPDDIAEIILFLLSDKAAMVNGLSMPVDGGYMIA